MKLAPISLSLLVFALITHLPFAFSDDVVEQVLDGDYNPVVQGGKYIILPTLRGPGGGAVTLGKTKNSDCPVLVLQHYFSWDGMPVRFKMSGRTNILTGTPLEIEFTWKPNCVNSSKWNVYFDNKIQKAYVGIGGPEEHPGNQPLSGNFRLRTLKRVSFPSYKLEFCVSGSPTCLEIERYANGEGGKRLILSEDGNYSVFFVVPSDTRIRSVV